ncbi:MAG: alpha/beta hydrolase [Leptonema illini]|uniref:Alpha/beta hydrolase n=1 Tax=Leptonema illini TaxID=183 RepID=A0A833LXQ3_9LEPT|nr:MAG: alpha/beta hydrolase [Leptonema illini]
MAAKQAKKSAKKTGKKAARRSTSSGNAASKKSAAINKSAASKKRAGSRSRRDNKKQLQTSGATGPLIRAIRPVAAHGPRPLRLLWIPGLGADRMMFARIIEELEPLLSVPVLHSFLEYPDVMAGEVDSLESLASLLAQGILPDDPYDMVIGYSMGGMMLQILRMKGMLEAKQCVLLCTAFSGNDLNSFMHRAASLPRPPVFLRGLAQSVTAALYPVFRIGVRDSVEYGRMFARFPRTIFFEGPRWIQQWQGVPEPFYSDCISAHGTRDPLLSYQKVSSRKAPDLTIEGGSHILFATHPDRLAQFLADHLKAKHSV